MLRYHPLMSQVVLAYLMEVMCDFNLLFRDCSCLIDYLHPEDWMRWTLMRQVARRKHL